MQRKTVSEGVTAARRRGMYVNPRLLEIKQEIAKLADERKALNDGLKGGKVDDPKSKQKRERRYYVIGRLESLRNERGALAIERATILKTIKDGRERK